MVTHSLSQSQSLINMTTQQWCSGDEPGYSISDQGWWGGKFWLEIRLTKLETINRIKSWKPQISELRRAHCSILCWEDRENGAVSTADDGWVFIFSFIFLKTIFSEIGTEIQLTKSNESVCLIYSYYEVARFIQVRHKKIIYIIISSILASWIRNLIQPCKRPCQYWNYHFQSLLTSLRKILYNVYRRVFCFQSGLRLSVEVTQSFPCI